MLRKRLRWPGTARHTHCVNAGKGPVKGNVRVPVFEFRAARKTPADIIGDPVRKEMAAEAAI
jgi:hypothetical protein